MNNDTDKKSLFNEGEYSFNDKLEYYWSQIFYGASIKDLDIVRKSFFAIRALHKKHDII